MRNRTHNADTSTQGMVDAKFNLEIFLTKAEAEKGNIQLGGILVDRGQLCVRLLSIILVLQLVVEGEEADGKVDLDGEDAHADPHRDSDDGAPAHLHHLLLLVVVHHSDSDVLSVKVPSGKADDGEDYVGDGEEEVEDGKDEHTAGSLQASPTDADQS